RNQHGNVYCREHVWDDVKGDNVLPWFTLEVHMIEEAISKESSETSSENEELQINCPECDTTFSDHYTFMEHYTNEHAQVLATANYKFAHEAGVYIAERNDKISTVKPSSPILLANGGTFHNGKVIFCAQGQRDIDGSIVSMDPYSILSSITFSVLSSIALMTLLSQKMAATEYVYQFDPSTGDIRVVADGFVKPNGIAFSPDEKKIYITDTGFYTGTGKYDPMRPHTIYEFDVNDNYLSNRRVFAVIDVGVPNGIKLDIRGNVYTRNGDGVQIFSSHGKLLGKIIIPGGVSNIVFARRTLTLLAETSIYEVKLEVEGGTVKL
ncbi:12135_t:CDS:2, partial [Acaulospora morrowiae]